MCEAYSQALNLIDGGKLDPPIADKLIEKLKRVFNRGFWGGYYLGHEIGNEFGQWTQSYGSAATVKKVYVGRVTNFFTNISVVEVLVEASQMKTGDQLVAIGATTGAVELTLGQLRIGAGTIVDCVDKGAVCSFKIDDEILRRGDKIYKFCPIVSKSV